MSRLEELEELARLVQVEIRHEKAAAARVALLTARVHNVLSRGSWNTRAFLAACEHFDVTAEDVIAGHRDRAAVMARHAAMWLMRDAGRSYPEIGRHLGCDHTTVIHGVRRVNADFDLHATCRALRAALDEPQEVDVA